MAAKYDTQIRLRATAAEKKTLEENAEEAGFANTSGFLREVIFEGHVLVAGANGLTLIQAPEANEADVATVQDILRQILAREPVAQIEAIEARLRAELASCDDAFAGGLNRAISIVEALDPAPLVLPTSQPEPVTPAAVPPQPAVAVTEVAPAAIGAPSALPAAGSIPGAAEIPQAPQPVAQPALPPVAPGAPVAAPLPPAAAGNPFAPAGGFAAAIAAAQAAVPPPPPPVQQVPSQDEYVQFRVPQLMEMGEGRTVITAEYEAQAEYRAAIEQINDAGPPIAQLPRPQPLPPQNPLLPAHPPAPPAAPAMAQPQFNAAGRELLPGDRGYVEPGQNGQAPQPLLGQQATGACPGCGAAITANTGFCAGCGTPL